MRARAGGAKMKFYADGNLEATFKNLIPRVEKAYDEKIDRLLIRLNELILASTPVWEGDTIRNWRWSTKAPSFERVDPIENPQDPGPTSRMPLGVEPRRRANEARPRRSLQGALRAKEPVNIYLTNTSETAVDLEAGLLPSPEKFRGRRGFLALAIREVFG